MNAVRTELVPLELPTLVEASAGTGKTHAITTYFVRAILEHGLTPEQILIVTYTKAATAELHVRARHRIIDAIELLNAAPDDEDSLRDVVADAAERVGRGKVEEALRRALLQMDQAPILTIHGFCQRLLQDHPLLFGVDFDFEIVEDVSSVLLDLAVDFWATELHDKPDWLLQALKEKDITPEHLAKLADIAMPGMDILGPTPEEVDSRVLQRWSVQRREAAEIWNRKRARISELLHDPGLYQNIYKPSTVESWLPGLDDFFATTVFELPKGFPNLAQPQIVARTKKGCEPPRHLFFEACERLVQTRETLDAVFAHAVFVFQERFIEHARKRATQRQKEQARLTYDDLLMSVYNPLNPSKKGVSRGTERLIAEKIREEYPIALVDEFQDTDVVQYGIFRAIYGEGAAVYVGDPKQAIYAFRGADVFSYLGAARDVGDRQHTLTTNRRSDPALVRAANALFSKRAPPFVLDGIGFLEATPHYQSSRSTFDPPMEIILLSEEQSRRNVLQTVPSMVANEIAHLLQSGAQIDGERVSPKHVAVLCRTNKQAWAVTEAIRKLRIPASLDGDSSVLSTETASEVEAVLEAALMPGDSAAVRRALLMPLLGVSPHELSIMDDETWSHWVSRFRDWHDRWQSEGVVRFLEDMLRTTDAETRMARHPSARRKLTDLLHIEELLLRGERERRREPIAVMQWFRRLRQGSPEDAAIAYEELQQRPDAQSDTVRVTTVHKSKGLEYGVVYCPFLWNDAWLSNFQKKATKFHDKEDGYRAKIDLGSERHQAHQDLSQRESLSEAVRLLYVAVTRAKHRCTLFWGPAKEWPKSSLAYLLHGEKPSSAMGEEQMRADIDALVTASSEAIGCRPPHAESAPPFEHEASPRLLRAQPRTRSFSQANRIASFSSLTGHHEKTPTRHAGAPLPDTKVVLFSNLPGGARTGLLLHSILEQVDFDALESRDAEELIERELHSYGYDPSLAGAVRNDLQAVVETRLMTRPDAPCLIDLPRAHQLRELEFTLSVDQGFLRGFIDLVFEWQGRWYIADYKSNSLANYEPATIVEAIQQEHYLLQVQLYAAAAHRYLAQRIPDYDAETHWGGALLLFLRGMRGADHAGSSVFFDRQSPASLADVDRWLGGINVTR